MEWRLALLYLAGPSMAFIAASSLAPRDIPAGLLLGVLPEEVPDEPG